MVEMGLKILEGVVAGTTVISNIKGLSPKNNPSRKPAKVRLRFHESDQILVLVNTGDSEAMNVQVRLIEGEWQSPFDNKLLMRIDAGESIEKKVFFCDYSLGDATFCVSWSDAETSEEFEDRFSFHY